MGSCCCSPFANAATRHFDAERVAEELKEYREHGPGETTVMLADGIAQAGELSGTVLDVGAGFGGLSFALLERGATRAVAVDASEPYVRAAREEATRRGRTDAIDILHGDFVDVASRLPTATIVTLDRVVCCYPFYHALVEAALARTERCLALSLPRDVWYVRAAMMIENARRRLARNPFRTFVHPVTRIEEMIRRGGFRLSRRRTTWFWLADVYVRR